MESIKNAGGYMYRGLSFVASGTKQLSVDAYTGLSGVLYDFASDTNKIVADVSTRSWTQTTTAKSKLNQVEDHQTIDQDKLEASAQGVFVLEKLPPSSSTSQMSSAISK